MSGIYIRRAENSNVVNNVITNKDMYNTDLFNLLNYYQTGNIEYLPPTFENFSSSSYYQKIFRTSEAPFNKDFYNTSFFALLNLYQTGANAVPYEENGAIQVQVNGTNLELHIDNTNLPSGVQISGLQLYVSGVELHPNYDAEDASGYLTSGHQLDGSNWIVACNTLIAPTDPANPTDALSILYLERNNNVVIDANGVTDTTGATTPAYDANQPIASFPIKNGTTAVLRRFYQGYASMIVQADATSVTELSLDGLMPV